MSQLRGWSGLACAGGEPIGPVAWSAFTYGHAIDNTEGCALTTVAEDAATLAILAISNVLRVDNELGTVDEYLLNNLQLDRATPTTTIAGKPVEALLNDVSVVGRNAGRYSTAITDTQTVSDWISLYALPSLAACGQPWWSLGTIDPTDLVPLQFVDQTVMWLIRQLLTNRKAQLVARRNGETGYYLDLVNLTVTPTPVAVVGSNVVALSRIIDDAEQANVIVMAGITASGNDEPERVWYVPFRAASLSGAVATLDDPSGQGTMILQSDGQPRLSTLYPALCSGMDWRLGCITQPIVLRTLVSGRSYELYRAVYLQSSKEVWCLFGATGEVGIQSVDLETRTAGSLLTTSLGAPVDAAYYAGTSTLFIADALNNTVVPCVVTGPTIGTPIAVGAGPRRILEVTGTSYDQFLVGHNGGNVLKQIDPTTNTVSATSTAMTTPAHLAPVSKTQVYVGSDTIAALYRYNASANTLTTTVVTGATGGYRSLVYVPGTAQVWAAGATILGGATAISRVDILDTTTDTVVRTIDHSTAHGAILDSLTLNGLVYGVTEDGQIVCYDATDYTLQWARRHAAWSIGAVFTPPATLNPPSLLSLQYFSDIDCFGVGAYSGTLYLLDAQTGSAMIARKLSAASAATPSVTLANSVFPLRQYDEVAFCRDDGSPLLEIPNEHGVTVYRPKMRTVLNNYLYGGSNRVLNGALTWFDSSRKVARFLNLTLKDGTCEAKWDGYPDPLVLTFAATANGAQAATAYVPLTVNFKTVGAGRVFLPGDILVGAGGKPSFMVLAKATADGSGNVALYCAASNSAGVADGDSYTVNRPDAATLLAGGRPSVVALPQLANGPDGGGDLRSRLAADINLPFIPGEMTNLYWGITAWTFGIDQTPNLWRVRILGLDRSLALLDVQPNPDTTTLAGRGLVPMSFTGSFPLSALSGGGHLQFNIEPAATVGGPALLTFYAAQLWVQVGNVDRGAPDTGPYQLYALGQQAGVDRADPFVSYTVQPRENDPANPFILGALIQLRDPEQGVVATPAIVTAVRTLPETDDDVVQPVLTLDNRNPSFIRRVVEAGGT